jgi:prepilin-type N-terminal cleavage/methylation domain-containing protein
MFTRIKASLAKKDEGFSLIELLVTVIIVGILAAVAIPIYIGVQNSAKDSAVKTDLTNIKTAVVTYYGGDNSKAQPTLDSATLGDFGFTQSAEYATSGTPAFETGLNWATVGFCIEATSVTGAAFHVSTNTGVSDGACGASSTW